MATSSKTPETPDKAAAAAVKATEPKEDEPTFQVDYAITNAFALVGEPTHVVASALAGVAKKNVTVSEIKAAVKKWQGSEVT